MIESKRKANKKYLQTKKGKMMKNKNDIKYRKNHPNYQKKYWEKNKEELKIKQRKYILDRTELKHNIEKNLKINGCSICGYIKCLPALEFHHVNPEDKKFGIKTWDIITRNEDSFVNEINKCILLCANCHREIEHLGDV